MKQIIASVSSDILFILFEIQFFVFLNLIIITARVYKLRLAEVNFLSCFGIYFLLYVFFSVETEFFIGSVFYWIGYSNKPDFILSARRVKRHIVLGERKFQI